MATTYTFSWDATAPQGAAGDMTLERSSAGVWSIVDDSSEPDGATHAYISQSYVSNKVSIGYLDFGNWVQGWNFDDTYVSGTYNGSVTGNWSSSFVSLIENSSGSGTGTEGVPVIDLNEDRMVISGLTQGTYELNALFGNGDVWQITVPATQSYTLYPGGSEASPANTDSLVKFSPGNYELGITPSDGTSVGTFTITASKKKVFCNFW